MRYNCAVTFCLSQCCVGLWIHEHNEERFGKWKLHYDFCFLSREACEAHYRAREGHGCREQDRMSEGERWGEKRCCKTRTEKQQESTRLKSGNWKPCNILIRIPSHKRSNRSFHLPTSSSSVSSVFLT